MSEFLAGKAVRKITTGLKVDTTSGVANGVNDLFEVVGGRVKVLQIMGVVTTQIGAGATVIHLQIEAIDLSLAAGPDIDGALVGVNIGITGAVGAAAVATAGYLIAQAAPQILNPGTINFNSTAARDGAIAWSVIYVPIDDGAYVEVA